MDRDGVINEDRQDYVKGWEEFRFIKGVHQALKQLNQAGVLVVVITNQAAIGKKKITEAELKIIHTHMLKAINKTGGNIVRVYYCPHHPDAHCRCRKPRIGLLKKAAQELSLDLSKSIFIGDTLKDIQAGNRAGCRTILVQTGQGQESLKKIMAGQTKIKPDWVCDSLPSATPLILDYLQK